MATSSFSSQVAPTSDSEPIRVPVTSWIAVAFTLGPLFAFLLGGVDAVPVLPLALAAVVGTVGALTLTGRDMIRARGGKVDGWVAAMVVWPLSALLVLAGVSVALAFVHVVG